ncbi:hypothetical protein HPB48_004603 [Haemaphysalis longicornis]|uniref:Uncharacterized protein n=1 Tax=Haemaphysalis longicornis TaxID=44386 RepID=A0A9J6FUD5_HAELO|nr:hypothetical protein HPB48_004603 [Haemaphysalis longicornis]
MRGGFETRSLPPSPSFDQDRREAHRSMAEGSGKPPANRGAIPKTPPFASGRLDAAAKSEALAHQGYQLCYDGRHRDGIKFFTRAISLNSSDHCYFANRSYACSLLGKHDRAFEDANTAVAHGPAAGQCHSCRGRYLEAQKALERAVQLVPCDEKARRHLKEARVREMADMGFTQDQAAWALEKGDNVEAAVSERSRVTRVWFPLQLGGEPSTVIQSVRILQDRHCAFINYTDKSSTARAMEELQGQSLWGASLVIRFPDSKLL